MKRFFLTIILTINCILLLICQDTNIYFNRYMEEGESAFYKKDYEEAIKNFRGALSVDNLNPQQKNNAAKKLKQAFTKYDEQLKAEKDKAIRNEKIAKANHKIAKENQKIAEARRLAFLSEQERNNSRKLNLAFYAKVLLDTQIQAVNESFNRAVQLKYEKKWDSIIAATFVYSDSLITVKSGEDNNSIVPFGENSYLTTSLLEYSVQLWEKNNSEPKEFQNHQTPITVIGVTSDNSYFLTGSEDGVFVLRNFSGNPLIQLEERIKNAYDAVFAPDNQTFFIRSSANYLTLWNINGGLIGKLNHDGFITTARFFGNRIITVSTDNSVKIWNGQNGKLIHSINEHTAPIYFIDISSDTTQFITFDANRKGILWNKEGEILKYFPKKDNLVNIRFAPFTNKWLYRFEKEIQLISENDTITIGKHREYINGIAFSPDRQYILSWSQDKTAKLWDFNGEKILEIDGFNSEVIKGEFSPNGKNILTFDLKNTMKVSPVPYYSMLELWEVWKSEMDIIRQIKKKYQISAEPNFNIKPRHFKRNSEKSIDEKDDLFSNKLDDMKESETKNSSENISDSQSNHINSTLKNNNTNKKDYTTDTENLAKQDSNKKTKTQIDQTTEKKQEVITTSLVNVQNPIPTEIKYFVTKGTGLKTGPHHSYKSLTRPKMGEEVILINDTENKFWAKVRYKGKIGWIKTACIAKL